ncbi:short chain dehydrogenase [uncultured Tateyamaria sp.]|uniref:short chain dehydrogenase n=1 Tax=uncultured Tateyamaria sp. TaxID=455651 RepID=UPI002631360C|nr:short chain dehydrogenase [uncultured Tateyamaria sp.]
MRILIVGAYGDVGRAACAALGERHDLIRAGRSRGDVTLDMSDAAAVTAMFSHIGQVDAVVSTAGEVRFCPLADHDHDTMLYGMRHKVMGQINLVLCGLNTVADAGSFTLTSGILDRDPVRGGIGAATANGALSGFVSGAAIEMPRGLRLNVVSPGLLDTSQDRYGALFPGHAPVPAEDVGRAYVKAVEGAGTGQVITVP